MVEQYPQTIAPAEAPLLTADKTINDLELLAIANYLKTYQPKFRPIVKRVSSRSQNGGR